MARNVSSKTAGLFRKIFVIDAFFWLASLVIFVGTFLRLHLICDQILLDDEWHSLHYVIGKPFGYLLTHFAIPGATCIPLNVYNLALLKTIGWSEIMLRLPSLIAGILALVLLPILVRPLMERRSALIFTMLLAISPVLIFYSRMARPYSLLVIFGFTSLMFGYYWLSSGQRTHCCAYLLAGALAVECHLFALPAIVVPLLIGTFCKSRQRWSKSSAPQQGSPNWYELLISGFILALVVGILQLPAFLAAKRTITHAVTGKGVITLNSIWNAASLVSGTANPVLIVGFIWFLLVGLFVLYRKNALAASIFVAALVASLAALLITLPESIHAAIVLVRYCIIFLPISYLLVALGLDACVERLMQRLEIHRLPVTMLIRSFLPGSFVLALFITGPWQQIFAQPNSFTNHSAFQANYKSIAWESTYKSEMVPDSLKSDLLINQRELSPFYGWLGEDKSATAIIEFPMMVGDPFNPYYYFQHFHKKRVLIGYDKNCPEFFKMSGAVRTNAYVDEVLNRVPEKLKLKLHNIVEMTDVEALKRSGAQYIVLHYLFEAKLSNFAMPNPNMESLIKLYKFNFSAPVYSDNYMIVFKIGAASDIGREK